MPMIKGMSVRQRRTMTIQERFNDFIVVSTDGCWIWVGGLTHNGYGRMQFDGKARLAHRISYEMHVGPIPPNLQIDHLCHEPRCVNWRHLEPVTALENLKRSPNTSTGMTHCKRGHALVAGNLIINSACNNKLRLCRTCHNARARMRRKLQKGVAW